MPGLAKQIYAGTLRLNVSIQSLTSRSGLDILSPSSGRRRPEMNAEPAARQVSANLTGQFLACYRVSSANLQNSTARFSAQKRSESPF